VVKPGNPPYLEYVRSSVEEKKDKLQNNNNREGSKDDKMSTVRGVPNLIYESEFIAGWEPSGVPVSQLSMFFRN
jgi:catechol O-methyltransferase